MGNIRPVGAQASASIKLRFTCGAYPSAYVIR
jgi:hypothetical protein